MGSGPGSTAGGGERAGRRRGAGRAAQAAQGPGPASRGTEPGSARIPPDTPAPRGRSRAALLPSHPSNFYPQTPSAVGAQARRLEQSRRCPAGPRTPQHYRSPRGAPLTPGGLVPAPSPPQRRGAAMGPDPAHLLKSRIRRRRAGVDMAEPQHRLPPALAARPHKQPAMAATCAGRG